MSARELNLDAARAARAEVAGEPPVIVFGGERFTLPRELPADFALRAAAGDLQDALSALFDDDDATRERFWALKPSLNDVLALVEGIGGLYGFDGLGESSASGDSSATTSSPSRPTSPAPIISTFGAQSFAAK